MKVLPGALGNLAKEFGCETQKGFFPHYFHPIKETGSINYEGPFPAYKYFEPKRTSQSEWETMAAQYSNNWSFLGEARKYLHGDCKALHEVLVKYFTQIRVEFQLNPINNLSIPGVAFPPLRNEVSPRFRASNLWPLIIIRL